MSLIHVNMQRRQLISVVGSGAVVALSGCSESSGASKEIISNAYSNTINTSFGSLNNAKILGTDAVVLPVIVENMGDSPIEFGLQTQFYDGNTVIGTDEASEVTPKKVGAGVSKEFEEAIEGRKEDVTKVEVQITETGGVDVTEDESTEDDTTENESTEDEEETISAVVGESIELTENVMATLEAVRLPWSFVTSSYKRRSDPEKLAISAPTGKQFAVAEFTFENIHTERVRIDRNQFSAKSGNIMSNVGGISLDSVQEPEISPLLESIRLDPAETLTRDLLIQFDDGSVTDDGLVEYNRDSENDSLTIRFESNESDIQQPPSFDLINVDVPTLNANSPSGTLSFTVENTSQNAGVFRGAVVWRDNTIWRTDRTASPAVFTEEIESGENKKFEMTWDQEDALSGTFTYRVSPFDKTFDIVFE